MQISYLHKMLVPKVLIMSGSVDSCLVVTSAAGTEVLRQTCIRG